MKKTLAIMLALLAAASITLASCEKDEPENPDNGWDDDNEYVDTKNDDTDKIESTDSTVDTGSAETENITTPEGWQEVVGNLYLGRNVILRSAPDETAGSKTDVKLTFGTALNRVRTNGRWEEVKYNGNLYYVKTIYTTTDGGNFTFTEDANKPALTISETTGNNVCFYKTPFYCEDTDENFANMLCSSGIRYNNLKGNAEGETYSLKKLATSTNGKWIKVEFVGTVEISSNNKATYTAENPGVFYIQSLAFKRGDVLGGGVVSDNVNTGDGDFVS